MSALGDHVIRQARRVQQQPLTRSLISKLAASKTLDVTRVSLAEQIRRLESNIDKLHQEIRSCHRAGDQDRAQRKMLKVSDANAKVQALRQQLAHDLSQEVIRLPDGRRILPDLKARPSDYAPTARRWAQDWYSDARIWSWDNPVDSEVKTATGRKDPTVWSWEKDDE